MRRKKKLISETISGGPEFVLKDRRKKFQHPLKLLMTRTSSLYLSGWKLRSPSTKNSTRERARARRQKRVDIEREICQISRAPKINRGLRYSVSMAAIKSGLMKSQDFWKKGHCIPIKTRCFVRSTRVNGCFDFFLLKGLL